VKSGGSEVMERVGVLVVAYGSREAAMIDALSRSERYSVEIYVADRHQNPFNVEKAKEHIVIHDLNVEKICEFTKKHRKDIDFGIVGPEGPIIEGVRDIIEKEMHIPMICPTKEYAIEKSKVMQRRLFEEVIPEVNPRFKVFDPAEYSSVVDVKNDLWKWLDDLNNQVVIKPDTVSTGKGVGVWGDHFKDRKELYEHFLSNYTHGPVIVEEKIEGEESSFQAFCDGKHLVPLPETRDNKRAFEDDQGPNTGGMGSYKDVGNYLPFMTQKEWETEVNIANRLFERLKDHGSNPGLRGIPFYLAFMHTGRGVKILENNSRPGDPEIQNLLPLLKDDFVDLCLRIVDGTLDRVHFENQASVVIYKVPPTYGGKMKEFSGDCRVDLSEVYRLSKNNEEQMRVYPGALESRAGEIYALTSRAVCVVGIDENLESARETSLKGIDAIKGGSLWFRRDIAAKQHIEKSIQHMKRLRH